MNVTHVIDAAASAMTTTAGAFTHAATAAATKATVCTAYTAANTRLGRGPSAAAPAAGAAKAAGTNSANDAKPAVDAPPLSNAYTSTPTQSAHSETTEHP